MATLTSKEKDLIRESWAVLHANKAQNAVAFFVLFFRKNPTYKDKFSHFRDQSLDELAKGGNPKLQVHASSVFDSFEAMVENIDDVAMTSSLWDNTSRRHYVSHGIDFHHFEDMETAFLEILKNKLGAKMTPEIDASWRKLFGIMNVNFKSNAAKLGKSTT
ncbi:PREDICTED: leghemoglobin-2-like [Priapulus caudatus]|uniref:Leghemoglobin-2-like n=1 Tax=Priapulus caudatus TaxID=37621 RepID=A0ABM1DVZ6_PRICU|nr:PREDICTED: leghemoglobin-2-like [Priapulus caudatus]